MAKQQAPSILVTGRMVQGNVWTPNTTDMEGNLLVVKSGPNKGQSRVEFYVALAIAKDSPDWAPAWELINHTARTGETSGLFDPAGNCIAPKFAWKYEDGDDPKNADKEGFPGHHILKFGSGYAPKVWNQAATAQMVEKDSINRGDYVRISFSVGANNHSMNPGVFLNLQLVQLVRYGEPITSGPDGAAVFGAVQASLPAGVGSATPLAGAPITTGAPSPAPGAATPAPAPSAAPNTNPTAAVAVAAPPAPPAPAADVTTPRIPKLLAKAGVDQPGVSYKGFAEAGWSDQQLVDAGYLDASELDPPF